MNCPNCGNVNQDSAQFCTNCGVSLAAASQQPSQAAPDYQAPQATPVYQTPDASYQQEAPQQTYAQQAYAPQAEQAYAQQTYAQQPEPYENQMMIQPDGSYAYPLSEQDKMLRLINFILCVVTTVLTCWTIISLAWMVPMTVHSWGIYKGTKPNTTAFGVCTLIFITLIGGILLLVSKKEK